MTTEETPSIGYLRVADVEVNAVAPGKNGFLLDGNGADGSEYRLDARFEMPIDAKTRAVIGELLSQSQWVLSRRIGPLVRTAAKPANRRANSV